MATITEDFCSYEVAKLLKEKGFDEFSYYGWDEQLFDKEHPRSFSLGFDNKEHWISCHTHQKAMKWLREEKHYYIQIMLDSWALGGHTGYYVVIQRIDNDFEIMLQDALDEVFYNSYEEAVEAALKYSLENLISNYD